MNRGMKDKGRDRKVAVKKKKIRNGRERERERRWQVRSCKVLTNSVEKHKT